MRWGLAQSMAAYGVIGLIFIAVPVSRRALSAFAVALFGGAAGAPTLHQRAQAEASRTEAPAPSHLEAIAFDAARRRLVLFGGSRRAADSAWIDSSETWEWDGARWFRMPAVADGPGARRGHALAYDPLARRVVLVGGVRTREGASGDDAFDDTWSYDGRRWERGPAAPVMSGHALVYDARAESMLLLGYVGREAPAARRLVIWRGTPDGWVFADSTGPQLMGLVRAAYDRNRSVLVVPVLQGARPRVWEWDGARWRDIDAPGPSPRSRYALAFDGESRRAILVGGRDDTSRTPLGDAWAWDGSRWTLLPARADVPEPRAGASLVADADSGRLLLYGGTVPSRGVVSEMWVWSSRAGWSRRSTTSSFDEGNRRR